MYVMRLVISLAKSCIFFAICNFNYCHNNHNQPTDLQGINDLKYIHGIHNLFYFPRLNYKMPEYQRGRRQTFFSKHHLSWKSDRRCLTIVPKQTFTFIWFVTYCSRYLNNLCFPTLDAYYCTQEIKTLDVKCNLQIECKILVSHEAHWHQNVVDLN